MFKKFFNNNAWTLGLGAISLGALAPVGAGIDKMNREKNKAESAEAAFQSELEAEANANKPKFVDPRKGQFSALSRFSVNPRQGGQGGAFNSALMMNAASMFPSLLR